MSKKIALLLIMVLFVNMVAWAQETDYSFIDSPGFIALCVGLAVLPLLAWWIMSMIDGTAEADAPDDGLMLVSNENVASTAQNSFDPVLKVLQHIEVNQTQENKLYVGLRFQY